MATQKQIAAAKHAREIKEMKQKYARKWGLHGIGLGNLTKITKEEAFDIVKDGGAIALGFAAGKIGGAMLKKAIIKPGEEDGAKKWIEAGSQVAAGFLISAMGKKNRFVANMGNGVFAAGAVTGIETATKKSITDLLSLSSSTATTTEERKAIEGLGKTIEEIEDINFNLNLEDPTNGMAGGNAASKEQNKHIVATPIDSEFEDFSGVL